MKKYKKARLAKKKKSPLARVFMAILLVVIFAGLTFICADISWYCTLSSRIVDGQEKAVEIRNAYIATNKSEMENVIKSHVSFAENVKLISVIDADGNCKLSVGNYTNGSDVYEMDVTDTFFENMNIVYGEEDNDYDYDEVEFDNNLQIFSGQSVKLLFESMHKKFDNITSVADDIMKIRVNYKFPLAEGEILTVSSVTKLYLIDVIQLLATIVLGAIIVVIVVIWNTIASIKAFKERNYLRMLYYSDAISGGNNMQYYYDAGKNLLLKYGKRNTHAIVDLRLEKYRNYCTCYGMNKGIELIEKIYQTLDRQVGKKELLAHPEKADFSLILKYKNGVELESRIRNMMASLRNLDADWECRFDAGVYLVEPGNCDVESMFNYAGVALSSGSDNNPDEILYYTQYMLEAKIWENTVEHDMQRALDNEEFKVFLQPKYSTKQEVLSGAEALVRWIHPEKGFISPGKFIPIFENNGFILKLDDFMISHVAQIQAKWMHECKPLVPISVNVSRAHFTRSDLAEHICGLVDMYNVPHKFIEIEITESSFFDDKEALLSTVKKLKSFGFEISMDDFGAGYSSLNSLKELPLDVLKLDAEFFRGVDEEGRGDVIVGEAITLAKKLDMRIVAEGIETREQVDSLANKDCDLIQGFYFAKPMPVEEFEHKAYVENAINVGYVAIENPSVKQEDSLKSKQEGLVEDKNESLKEDSKENQEDGLVVYKEDISEESEDLISDEINKFEEKNMINAILTIDDIASKNTPAIVDYLNEKGIQAVMFATGANVDRYYDNAIYTLQKGMIVGNHSYSHPAFSKISLEEGINEIEKNEELLNKLYKDAGVERKYRPFRFPYGDKGGDNKQAYQDYFKSHGFNKLKDTQITDSWWSESGLNKDIDTLWTFDFAEYNIRQGSGFTKESVWERMDNANPPYGSVLFADGSNHILLLHAHDETDELVPGYYKLFIDYLLEKGVTFVKPEFFE